MKIYTISEPGRKKDIRYYKDGECWICISHAISNGRYPVVVREGVMMNLARYLLGKRVKLEKKWDTLHSCDNKLCINPQHLSLGTRSQNLQDAYNRGLRLRGEDASFSKVTEKDIRFIRSSKLKGVQLANRFQLSVAEISRIRYRTRWAHVR